MRPADCVGFTTTAFRFSFEENSNKMKLKNKISELIETAYREQLEVLDIGETQKIVEVGISELLRPNFHKRQLVESRIKSIVQSLTTHGFIGGIVINGITKEVLDSWHRAELWSELGHSSIPAIEIYPFDENVAKELHLRLNQTHAGFDLSEFDLHFKGFDLSDFGITEDEIIQAGQLIKKQRNDQPIPVEENKGIRFAAVIPQNDVRRLRELKDSWNLPTMGHVISKLLNQITLQS